VMTWAADEIAPTAEAIMSIVPSARHLWFLMQPPFVDP
jgi:hypothetical protein